MNTLPSSRSRLGLGLGFGLIAAVLTAHAADSPAAGNAATQVLSFKALKQQWQQIEPSRISVAATNGDATAQFYLGYQLLSGSDTNRFGEGVHWARLAAEAGLAAGQDLLGWACWSGRGTARDYQLAGQWMRRAADQGLVEAEYDLGRLYRLDLDNVAVAAEWFRKAADHGNASAMYELADLYHYGKLGNDQRPHCIPWFLKAATNGNVRAQSVLGDLLRYYPDSELLKSIHTVDFLRQSAEKGDLDAQFRLAKRYQTGDGVPADAVAAFQWMQKAAQQDGSQNSRVSDARYELALMYEKGEGVERDEAKARELIRSAVEDGMHMGSSPARRRLAQMYEKGEAVPQNDRAAAALYSNNPEALLNLYVQGRGLPEDKSKIARQLTSMERGIRSAKGQFLLGEIYYQGKLVPKDTALAVAWFQKAAVQGSAEAMNRIGRMWSEGIDGSPDMKEAAGWYRKAAFKGLAEAQANLAHAYESGDGVEKNLVEAATWYRLAGDRDASVREALSRLETEMTEAEKASARERQARLREQISKSQSPGGPN